MIYTTNRDQRHPDQNHESLCEAIESAGSW